MNSQLGDMCTKSNLFKKKEKETEQSINLKEFGFTNS